METFQPGEVISYVEMCVQEGASLQRGMNFHLRGSISVILMSVRPGAPYADQVEDGGKILIYEGHDSPKSGNGPSPKTIDQPEASRSGARTQNGLFWNAVLSFKKGEAAPERVRVYEKIKTGIWAYAGIFGLIDAWKEEQNGRRVYKFKLEVCSEDFTQSPKGETELGHARLIPTQVKMAVWKRDKGRCVRCGSAQNLHFDHILPFSKGGTSLLAENIQLLCAKHNLQKRDKIE